MKILVINGPNLARLDIRDSSIYGDLNYKELVILIEASAMDSKPMFVKAMMRQQLLAGYMKLLMQRLL